MRRLYSTFAGGWPGMGLLFMRLVVGSVLLVRASWVLRTDPSFAAALTFVSLAGPGLLLVAGLWTPLAGMAVAAIELSQIFTGGGVRAPLMAATMAAALAMLGPGRWSLDARLFGWKRIEATPRGRTPNTH